MKQVRIKDIAGKAGVSIGTVDRVLHNRGEVAAGTREKILSITRELRYQPNIIAQALTTKKKYHIAALVPSGTDDNQYWLAHPRGMDKAIEELRPFNVQVDYFFFELHNGDDFIDKARKVAGLKPDGVIFAPILKKESLQFCLDLDQSNIPYIFIDTHLEETNCLTFIGEDAYRGGRVAASLIDYGLEIDKDILIVNISKDIANTQHLNRRNQGFTSYFLDTGKNRGLKITAEIPSPGFETVSSRMDHFLGTNPNIGAILVSSSKTHVIARYLELNNHTGIILVGYEITPQNIDYLKRGVINFLIGQKPLEQSNRAIKRMFEYLTTRQELPGHDFQPVGIVNVENVDLY